MAEEDVDWGMDEDFDPWQGAEEVNGSAAAERPVDENRNGRCLPAKWTSNGRISYSSLVGGTLQLAQDRNEECLQETLEGLKARRKTSKG